MRKCLRCNGQMEEDLDIKNFPTIKNKDYLITETPGFRMYFNHLQYIYKSKRYKQFYYEMKQGEEATKIH